MMGLFETKGTILSKEFRKTNPHWPKHLAGFSAGILALLFGLQVISEYIESRSDSPRAKSIKAVITPIADQLEVAQKVGDRVTAIALLEKTTHILNEYNSLNEEGKSKVNNSPLRYCLLAAINLADGIQDVISSGSWTTKDKYQNALDMCK